MSSNMRDTKAKARRSSLVRKRVAPPELALDPALTSLIEVAWTWYYWEQDENLRFTRLVGTMFKNGSVDPNIYIGKTRWELGVTPVSDGGTWDKHRRTLAAHQPFSELLFQSINPQLERRYISTTGQPVFDENGRFTGYRGISHDVTRKIRAERRLTIEHDVAQILAEATNIEEAAPKILRTICEVAGWTCGAYWEIDPKTQTLRCIAAESAGAEGIGKFLSATRSSSPLDINADSLLAAASNLANPVSISDLSQAAHFSRREVATKAGLRNHFAFPVRLDGRSIGAFEFFDRQCWLPDTELEKAATAIGNSIGQFIDRKKSEEELRRFRAVMDISPDTIYLIDRETLRHIDCNEMACQWSGYTREELLALGPHDLAGETHEHAAARLDDVIAKYPASVRRETILHARDGRRAIVELHQRALRSHGKWHILTISRDIDERKHAEKAMLRLSRMYTALSATNEAILRAKSPQMLYQNVCEVAVSGGMLVNACVLLPDPATSRIHVVAATGPGSQQLREFKISTDASRPEGGGLIGTAFRSQMPVVTHDYLADEHLRPWHDAARANGWGSGAAIPLVNDGRTIGVLSFLSGEREAFDEEIVKLLERMAENVVFALGNLEREVHRQQTVQALRASEEKHRAILENMSEGYWEVDLSGNYTFFNEALRQHLGYERDELMGMSFRSFYDATDTKRTRDIFKRVYQTGLPDRMTNYRCVRKDGTKRVFESSVQLIVDETGKPTGFRGVSRDITDHFEAEEAVRASEERYRTILESIEDAYYEVDLKGSMVFFNTAYCRMSGYSASELAGLNYRQYTQPDVAENIYQTFNEVYRTGLPTTGHAWELSHKDGSSFFVEGSVQLVRDKSGAPSGFRGILRDVTKRRRDEQLLLLEHTITRHLAEANTKRKIIQAVLRVMCDSEEWEGGGFWIRDEPARVFRMPISWRGKSASEKQKTYYDAMNVANGYALPEGGLMSEVWRTGQPLWVPDISKDPRTIWRNRAAATNELSTFYIPAVAEGKVLAVIAFNSERAREPDERLLRTANIIGQQLGQFLQRKQAEEVLLESEARFRALTELSSDWYWEQDDEFRFTRLESRRGDNQESRQILLGKRGWETGFDIDLEGGWSEHREAVNAHKPYRDIVMHRQLPDGSRRYISVSGEPVFDESGKFRGYRGVTREITAQKLAEERIQYLATHDALTDLPNRIMFSQLLSAAIESARRYGRKFAVLFIDLDRFKVINDTLGHDAGDRLLKEVGSRLKQTLRASDVIARLGGDEFVVLVHEVSEPQQIMTICRKILSSVIKPIHIAGQDCRVTASIGISMYPADAQDEQSLMRNADMAMYLAKEEGKNNFQFYSQNIQKKSLERLLLETNLRHALERNELYLVYQPRVDLKTGAITGVEALLRWQSPVLGAVSPAQFIPIAEETGLIVPIGQWVLRTACAQNAAWQAAGLPPMRMAVNLSVRQFTDENLSNDISTALRDAKLAPELLELEITEGMVMHDAERAAEVLTAIRDLGVQLAIDDFGTGYSSLAQIKRFPIDMLKIDRSFIRDIPNDAEDKAITEAIIAMAKTLRLVVVAEGVETREQADFLRVCGCDEMQGYYFSKPIAPEEVAELLTRNKRLPN